MARTFDPNYAAYLYVASAVITDYPHTMSAWFTTDPDVSNWADRVLVAVSDQDAANSYGSRLVIFFRGVPTSINIRAESHNNDSTGIAVSGNETVVANTWYHAAGVFTSSTDREVYYSGLSADTDATDIAMTGLSHTSIGAVLRNSSYDKIYWGSVAEVGIWNVALTASEIATLSVGYSPLLVRPQSLVFYVPLVRDNDDDIVGGLSMTAVVSSGFPGIATHPPIIYPSSPIYLPKQNYSLNVTAEAALAGTNYGLAVTMVPGGK